MANRLDGAARVALGVARGRDFLEAINIENADLSAYTFTAQLREYADSQDTLASFIVSTPVFDGTNTTLAISMPNTTTSATPESLCAGGEITLAFDLQIEAAGIKQTLLYGTFTIHGRVTYA